MGNNEAYTYMEETVVRMYDLLEPTGQWSKTVLSVLLEPYRDTDIDHGGMQLLETHDGLLADDVIVKTFQPAQWAKIQAIEDETKRSDKFYDVFYKIVREEFGWG